MVPVAGNTQVFGGLPTWQAQVERGGVPHLLVLGDAVAERRLREHQAKVRRWPGWLSRLVPLHPSTPVPWVRPESWHSALSAFVLSGDVAPLGKLGYRVKALR